MNREIFRFQFHSGAARGVEELLQRAIEAVECLHGESRVRLDISYHVDEDQGACIIEANDSVGEHLMGIFTGFAIRSFGEDAFSVTRLDRMADSA